MATTEAARFPEMVYGLVWMSDYAGDVPGDEIVFASLDRAEVEAHPKCRKATGDGWSMRTNGQFRPRQFPRPKSIATLDRKFGDRAIFAAINDGTDVGCWIDDRPHRLDEAAEEWTWNREERDYLLSYFMATGEIESTA